ncbi:MAG: energy transducer TonB [Bacteroidales bacterium]|nr:energy transducer TonB [Bacteroidales bacterium]
MKKIVSLLAIAALVFVACNNKKPSAETVSAEAAKAANALVEAIASGDDAAIKDAIAAKQAVLKDLKIEDNEELDALFDDAFDVALEDNGVAEEDIDALLKLRGIELPVLEKAAVEAAAETGDKAGEILDAAAEKVAEESAEKAAEAAEAAKEAAEEAIEEVAEEVSIPFITVQQKPLFEGSSSTSAFSKWVASQIVYPEAAQAAGKEGRVVLKFVVAKDGSVQNVKVMKGVDPELDAEAVRVVASSPAWTPGQQNGEPVAVNYTFPVVYKMNN